MVRYQRRPGPRRQSLGALALGLVLIQGGCRDSSRRVAADDDPVVLFPAVAEGGRRQLFQIAPASGVTQRVVLGDGAEILHAGAAEDGTGTAALLATPDRRVKLLRWSGGSV